MPSNATILLTRPPIVALRATKPEPLDILREYAYQVPAMGPAGLAAALRGESPMVVLERVARVDGRRLGAVS